MEFILKIGEKVRVGDQIGEAKRLEQTGASSIMKVTLVHPPKSVT